MGPGFLLCLALLTIVSGVDYQGQAYGAVPLNQLVMEKDKHGRVEVVRLSGLRATLKRKGKTGNKTEL